MAMLATKRTIFFTKHIWNLFMGFEKKISDIPMFMAAIIAFCMMLPTGLFLIADDYFKMTDSLESLESRYLGEVKNELRNRSEGFIKFIESRNNQTMLSTRSILKKRVIWAKSVLSALSSNILKENHGIKNKETLKKTLRDLLRDIRIEGESEGYFFAIDKETGTSEVYPPAPYKENTNLAFLRDIKGKILTPEILKLGKEKGSGYLTYKAPKIGDTSGDSYVKISYVDTFEPVGWFIGTGAYVDEIEKQIMDEAVLIISDIEFSANRHVLIMNSDGEIISRTRNMDSVDKDTPLNINRSELINAIKKSSESSEGVFTEYSSEIKPDGSRTKYLGYIKCFAPWKWYIISGYDTENISEYISEKKSALKEKIIKQMLYLSGALAFIIVFAISLGQYFKTATKMSFKTFMIFFQKTGVNYEHIDLDSLKFHELKELGKYANIMVDQRLKQERIINAYTKGLLGANKKLKSMANIDSMTGIANRRHFDNTIQKEWARSIRSSKIISAAIIDVDFFKQYNDVYGHPAGDECLRKIASAMMAAARRPYDLVARYGGEEFVILFPETDREGAITVAHAISVNLNNFNIPHAMNPKGRITFSMGIAAMIPQPGTRPESLMKIADEMLYKAKRSGRNMACIDDDREIHF